MKRISLFRAAALLGAPAPLLAPFVAAAQGGSRVTVQSSGGTVALPAKDSIVTIANRYYKADPFQRLMLGHGYRDLWTTPIKVPVLDISAFDGGLKATKTGGGAQTKNLRLETPDGREYVFRPVHKALLLDLEGYEGTVIKDLFADGLSSSYPVAPVIAPPFLEAVGVLHPKPILVVMGDNERLGEFREEFAGKLGTIEEYPSVPKDAPGFAGAVDIIDSDELLEQMNEDPRTRVDASTLLKARLVDILLGDNDRHPGQWRWAQLKKGDDAPWVPIPRDRDKVFVSHDGLLLNVARMAAPNLVTFEGRYPRMLFRNALMFDRRLLASLDRATWDTIAQEVRRAITDSVIDAALSKAPREYQRQTPELRAKLQSRRNQLLTAADRYYRALFSAIDLHGTAGADQALVRYQPDGNVDVELRAGNDTYFRRRFDPRETSEVRIYLHDGDDNAVVAGTAPRGIPIRIIGGNGTNRLADSSHVGGRAVYLNEAGTVSGVRYDSDTLNGASYDPDTAWNRRPWVSTYGQLIPPGRDRGVKWSPIIGLKRGRGLGIAPKVGIARTTYAYGTVPYSSRIQLATAYSTLLKGVEVELDTDHRLENSRFHVMSENQWSEIEVAEFRGFGNDVPNLRGDFYRVQTRQWFLNPAIGFALGPESDISFGPILKHTTTDTTMERFISEVQPYGVGSFGQAGVQLSLYYESDSKAPTSSRFGGLRSSSYTPNGFVAELDWSYYPELWDNQFGFSRISALGVKYFTIPFLTNPVLAFRAGGEKLYGSFPYFEAAFLGGSHSLRGFRRQRFAGDASLHGSAELRLPVAKFPLILPLNVGLIGLYDVGRVYMDGKSPGGWHNSAAAGLWLGAFNPGTNIHVLFTNSRERKIRFGLGFDY